MHLQKILCISILLLANSLSCHAFTVKESNSEEYLLNHGHSKEIARLITLQHKQINGEPVNDTKKNLSIWPIRMLKKFQLYIDPYYDDEAFGKSGIEMNHSDFKENL